MRLPLILKPGNIYSTHQKENQLQVQAQCEMQNGQLTQESMDLNLKEFSKIQIIAILTRYAETLRNNYWQLDMMTKQFECLSILVTFQTKCLKFFMDIVRM